MKFTRLNNEATRLEIAKNNNKLFVMKALPSGLKKTPDNVLLMPTTSADDIRQTFEHIYSLLGQKKMMEIAIPYKNGKPYFDVDAALKPTIDAEFAMLEKFINEKHEARVLPDAYRKAFLGETKPQAPAPQKAEKVEKAEKSNFRKNIFGALSDLFKYLGGSDKKSPKQIFTSFVGKMLGAVANIFSGIFKKLFGESAAKQFDGFAKEATDGVAKMMDEGLSPSAAPGLSPSAPSFMPSGGPSTARSAPSTAAPAPDATAKPASAERGFFSSFFGGS